MDIEFGVYVIALRVCRVDNTKMEESGVSIREGCENFFCSQRSKFYRIFQRGGVGVQTKKPSMRGI